MRRGVSPVIATVLLIGIVIELSGIVYIWARGFVQEGLEKRGEPIERSCDAVQFEAGIISTGGTYYLDINNRAEIPIYGFVLELLGQGSSLPYELTPHPVEPGASASISLNEISLSGSQGVKVVPVLMGQKRDSEGRYVFQCPSSAGVEIETIP